MKVNVLSTYISPPPNTIEEKLNSILIGSQQLSLMANSLELSGHDFRQYVISSANIKIKDAVILPVNNVDQESLTLEIIKLHRNHLLSSKDDECWIVCDPDFLFFGDVFHVFRDDFDVAMTYRNSVSMPYNSGIFFLRNNQGSASHFFKIQADIVEKEFKENARWFGDQLVLKHIIDHAFYDEVKKIYRYDGLKIKLLDSEIYNYSPNREHPNLLLTPRCLAYHFKGRCRSYMRYFYKHYVDDREVNILSKIELFFDFLLVEWQRKKVKKIYEAAMFRHRPK